MPKIWTLVGRVADSFKLKETKRIIKMDQRVYVLADEYYGSDIKDALNKGFLEEISIQIIGEIPESYLEKMRKGEQISIKNVAFTKVSSPTVRISGRKNLVPEVLKRSTEKIEESIPIPEQNVSSPVISKVVSEIDEKSLEKLAELISKQIKNMVPTTTTIIHREETSSNSKKYFDDSSVVPVFVDLGKVDVEIKSDVETKEDETTMDVLQKLKGLRNKK